MGCRAHPERGESRGQAPRPSGSRGGAVAGARESVPPPPPPGAGTRNRRRARGRVRAREARDARRRGRAARSGAGRSEGCRRLGGREDGGSEVPDRRESAQGEPALPASPARRGARSRGTASRGLVGATRLGGPGASRRADSGPLRAPARFGPLRDRRRARGSGCREVGPRSGVRGAFRAASRVAPLRRRAPGASAGVRRSRAPPAAGISPSPTSRTRESSTW